MRLADIVGWGSGLARGASHLGVWAGLYVTGAVICFAQLSGVSSSGVVGVSGTGAGFAFCTATAVYLLDRVKLRDSWLDPADAVAHPARFGFVSRHAKALRVLMGCLLLVASWLGERLVVGGAVMPLLAATGVLVYAGRPRQARSRPKDVLILKNAYVALGIAGFAGIVVHAAERPGMGLAWMAERAGTHAVEFALAFVLVAGRVFADAVLCDLDDEHADRKFGTNTLPTELGRERAWGTAFRLRLVIAAALVILTPLPLRPRLGWAVVTVASSVALRLASPVRVRDWVDIRMAVEAIAIASVMSVMGNR